MMCNKLDKYFKKDKTGYYLDKTSGEYKLRGVKGVNNCWDETRNDVSA